MDENSIEQDKSSDSQDVKDIAKAAGGVAMSAVLATSLSAALSSPPRVDQMSLSEPVPIVQTLEEEQETVPEPEEVQVDEKEARRKRILKMLRFLVVAILIVATLIFGALKGCTSCTAGMLMPEEEQGSSA